MIRNLFILILLFGVLAGSNARPGSDRAVLDKKFYIYGDTIGGPGFPGNPNPIPLDPVPVSPDPTNPPITPPDPNRPVLPPPTTNPPPSTGIPTTPVVTPKDSSGIVPDPLTKTPSKDPCAGKEAVNERADKKAVDEQNKMVGSMTNSTKKEAGAIHNFDNLTGKNLKLLPIGGGSTSHYSPGFSWDAKAGYTVGSTHGHPSNSAPSPADAMWGAGFVNQIPADGGQRDLYTNYYQMYTITDHSIYVLTVKDVQAWVDLGAQFNKDRPGFNDKYQYWAEYYMTENSSTNQIAAGEYALLKMFEKAVNLYKSGRTAASFDFKPLKIEGQNVTEDPCDPKK